MALKKWNEQVPKTRVETIVEVHRNVCNVALYICLLNSIFLQRYIHFVLKTKNDHLSFTGDNTRQPKTLQ